MAVAKLDSGELVFHNAISLDEEEMKELESWGRPTILLVTNGWHRLDVHAFKARYPQMRVLCPKPVELRVREAVDVDGFYDAFPDDPSVQLVPLRGSKVGEGVLVVQSAGRVSLCFSDTVMNIQHARGLDGLLFKLLGSVGSPRVTPLAKWFAVGDRQALREHLQELSKIPGLSRIIPTHGDVVNENAPATMQEVARSL
jgi:hypothetical protein